MPQPGRRWDAWHCKQRATSRISVSVRLLCLRRLIYHDFHYFFPGCRRSVSPEMAPLRSSMQKSPQVGFNTNNSAPFVKKATAVDRSKSCLLSHNHDDLLNTRTQAFLNIKQSTSHSTQTCGYNHFLTTGWCSTMHQADIVLWNRGWVYLTGLGFFYCHRAGWLHRKALISLNHGSHRHVKAIGRFLLFAGNSWVVLWISGGIVVMAMLESSRMLHLCLVKCA